MAKARLVSWSLQELKKPLSDTNQTYFFLRRELEALLHIQRLREQLSEELAQLNSSLQEKLGKFES